MAHSLGVPHIGLISQGQCILSWPIQNPFLQPQATCNTPAPTSQPFPSHPAHKELASTTWLLPPGPPSRTTCCAIMSGTFASATARGHGQGQEEHERWPEEGSSVPGLRTFLAGSPGAQGTVATWPAIVMLCAAGTLQPPVGTPGEEVTLYMMEAVEDCRDLVDGEEVGIGRECHWLGEHIMEEVEAVADEERK
nr:unnamed protein product [Rangifer tarandus platyrhynchus]